MVFSNELRRARLEEILLPLIAAEAWARMETVPAGQVAVYDVPLLAEGQMQDLFDLVVVVETNLELRLERLARRGMKRDEALARISSQATDEERRAVADIVLSNSGSIDQLSADVDRLLEHPDQGVGNHLLTTGEVSPSATIEQAPRVRQGAAELQPPSGRRVSPTKRSRHAATANGRPHSSEPRHARGPHGTWSAHGL